MEDGHIVGHLQPGLGAGVLHGLVEAALLQHTDHGWHVGPDRLVDGLCQGQVAFGGRRVGLTPLLDGLTDLLIQTQPRGRKEKKEV